MKKILHFFSIQDSHRDMSVEEKLRRDNKIFILCILALLMTIFTLAPLYAESIPKSQKFEIREEWICPNKACGYDNYDGIRYCGLCGTERSSRRR
jgi:hypothetical protein